MKRAEQLQKLLREHHGSLVMAKNIGLIAKEGSEQDLLDAIETVKITMMMSLKNTFSTKSVLFSPLFLSSSPT